MRKIMDNFNNWNPAFDDYYNPGSSILRNDGPAKNYVRMANQREGGQLFIKNIPLDMSQDGLEKCFHTCGVPVINCKLLPPKDNYNKKAGFVTVNSSDMEKAIKELNDTKPLHLKIEISQSIPKLEIKKKGLSMTDFNQNRYNKPASKPLQAIKKNSGPNSYDGNGMQTQSLSHRSSETSIPNLKIPLLETQKDSKYNHVSPIHSPIQNGSFVNISENGIDNSECDSVPENQFSDRSDNPAIKRKVQRRKLCNYCKEPNCTQRCEVCRAYYCSEDCRDDDWPEHQKFCRPPPRLVPASAKAMDSTCYDSLKESDNPQNIQKKEKPENFSIHEAALPSESGADFVNKSAMAFPTKIEATISNINEQASTKSCNPQGVESHYHKGKSTSISSENRKSAIFERNSISNKRIPQAFFSSGLSSNYFESPSHGCGFQQAQEQSAKHKKNPQSRGCSAYNNPSMEKKLANTAFFLRREVQYRAFITEVEMSNFKIMIESPDLDLSVLTLHHLDNKPEIPLNQVIDGQLVAAYSENYNKLWYRGFVISHTESYAKVCFIDYGNVDSVRRIKQLESKYSTAKLPAHSMFCSLDHSSKDLLKPVIANKLVELSINEIKGDNVVGYLLDDGNEYGPYTLQPWSTPYHNQTHLLPYPKKIALSINEKSPPPVKELADLNLQTSFLQAKECLKENKAVVPLSHAGPSARKILSSQLRQKNLVPNQALDVKIVYIDASAGALFIHEECDQQKLDEMKEKIEKFVLTTPFPEEVSVGELLLVKFLYDNEWYRAEVLEMKSDKINVNTVDFGQHITVELEQCRPFLESLLNYPLLAIQIPLNSILSDTLEVIQNCIDQSSLLKFVIHDINPLQFTLCDEENIILDTKSAKNVAPAPKLPSPSKELRRPRITNSPRATQFTPKVRSYEELNKIGLEVGTMETIFFTYVSTSEEAFAIPTNIKEEYDVKLEELRVNMTMYCKTKEKHFYAPKLNEIVLAKFSADSHWYRGAVMDLSTESAYINFVDYGNSEMVSFKNICQMVTPFLDLPLVAVPCKFDGITKDMINADNLKAIVIEKSCNVKVISFNDEDYFYHIEMAEVTKEASRA